jgi:Uma2 family endonuclease
LDWYRAHPCVDEYILVNTRFQLVEIYQRNDNGSWSYLTYGAGKTIELTSLDLYISVDALYEGLRIPVVQDDEQYVLAVQEEQ